jgi:hypothetical protein
MELYEKIALNKDWSLRFLACYMCLPTPVPATHMQLPNPGPAPACPYHSKRGGTDTMLANMMYKNDLFAVFKAMNIKTQDIMARTTENPQPKSSDGTTLMCLSYHQKGIWNE